MSKVRRKGVKKWKYIPKIPEDIFEQPEFADENIKFGRYIVEKIYLHQVYSVPLNLETLKICGWVTFEEPVKLQHCIIPRWLCPSGISGSYHSFDGLNFDSNVIFLGGLSCDDVNFIE